MRNKRLSILSHEIIETLTYYDAFSVLSYKVIARSPKQICRKQKFHSFTQAFFVQHKREKKSQVSCQRIPKYITNFNNFVKILTRNGFPEE